MMQGLATNILSPTLAPPRPAAAPQSRPVPLSPVNGTATGLFDERYLAALAARNTEVENHFISWFSTPVRAKLRARLRSPELVEDAYQETFLRVLARFQSGKTLRNPASLPAFMHAVAHRTALEFLRVHTRQDQLPERHQDPVDSGVDPLSQLVTLERQGLVRRVLAELPEKDQQVLTRVFNGDDKDGICRDLHVNRDHLRLLVCRALKRLRIAMDRDALRGNPPPGLKKCEMKPPHVSQSFR